MGERCLNPHPSDPLFTLCSMGSRYISGGTSSRSMGSDYTEGRYQPVEKRLDMNHKGRRIAGVVAFLLTGFLVWQESTPSEPTRAQATVVEPAQMNPNKRRARNGPRTPPPAAAAPLVGSTNEENPSQLPRTNDEPPEAPVDDAEGLTDQERKLEVYLEHVDAIEDPNVDELTMLGEMAFEANEAQAAYDHYLEVIEEHTDEPRAPFALYKLAWAEYNLGDVDAAIDDMELMMEWLDYGESPMEQTLRVSGPADLKMFRGQAG
jgi:hypothetical protein